MSLSPLGRAALCCATALIALALAACGPKTPGSCTDRKPLFYQGKCYSERGMWEAFSCEEGNTLVLRQKNPPGMKETRTMRWDVCCQNPDDATHCVEIARGEGPIGEHWICPGKVWSKTPCPGASP